MGAVGAAEGCLLGCMEGEFVGWLEGLVGCDEGYVEGDRGIGS